MRGGLRKAVWGFLFCGQDMSKSREELDGRRQEHGEHRTKVAQKRGSDKPQRLARIHTFSLARAGATSYVVKPDSLQKENEKAGPEGLRLLSVLSAISDNNPTGGSSALECGVPRRYARIGAVTGLQRPPYLSPKT